MIERYWGKADLNYPGQPKWHPLVYHCLDVAAVASAWWDASSVVRRVFMAAFDWPDGSADRIRAWVLFFVALHDLGKFDVRFQLKAPEAVGLAWPELGMEDVDSSLARNFDHGLEGYAWAMKELAAWAATEAVDLHDAWRPWMAAVAGHHGDLPSCAANRDGEYAEHHVMEHDRLARSEFVSELAGLLLAPQGVALKDLPPPCSPAAQAWLAGFCAVCDWVGSNAEAFSYRKFGPALAAYLDAREVAVQSNGWLRRFGLIGQVGAYAGVQGLLKADESPRGVQVRVDDLPLAPGLVLIEAPTGSGKTEAALAHAWRLLAAGVADSIVFALPTQATANAMLSRAEAFAGLAFGDANVVLAHGNSRFNPEFEHLMAAGRQTAQGREDAGIQCVGWLASSRKRVFLGQVGVCTVDQTLLSVLPVRHKFVRSFGLNKSVLIVDEVHAYDAYMHGLLGEVLRRQKATGGSAILLSATLPSGVRNQLLEAWCARSQEVNDYPALWFAPTRHSGAGWNPEDVVAPITLPPEHRPEERLVEVELLYLPGAFPDDALRARVIAAAESGARVVLVMNLVDDAQRLARLLRSQTRIDVDVFHARYRFIDRQGKEQAVLAHYGRHAARDGGRILVATQVVEQSLDLDFDWMVTQICPVDLLFQRLGRLHRHPRPEGQRPDQFRTPRCAVLSVDGEGYGLHELIYGNTRVLWRTEQLLAKADRIRFPAAYREWIESVYAEPPWDDEPDEVYGAYCAWRQDQGMRQANALRLTTLTVSKFKDEDTKTTALTRDDEMSLSVLPIQEDGRLLNGEALDGMDDRMRAEALNLNTVPVPQSWTKRLAACRRDDDGRLLLVLSADGQGGWVSREMKFHYSEDFGLEKDEGQGVSPGLPPHSRGEQSA